MLFLADSAADPEAILLLEIRLEKGNPVLGLQFLPDPVDRIRPLVRADGQRHPEPVESSVSGRLHRPLHPHPVAYLAAPSALGLLFESLDQLVPGIHIIVADNQVYAPLLREPADLLLPRPVLLLRLDVGIIEKRRHIVRLT